MNSKLNHQNHHIIFIGFKSVGKSAIGKEIAARLHKSFIDIDKNIENMFESENQKKLSCRQIMLQHGQDYFRNLENKALQEVIISKPSIISLGGGTLLNEENQKLIRGNIIIHVIAPKSITFERIMINGRPAFFSPDENPLETFNKLWDEREKTYKKLANFTIKNDGTINEAVNQILEAQG